MDWIKIDKDKLPDSDERVLVWVKWENETEFTWDMSELDNSNDNNLYIEPNSGKSWLMGSAINYEITHFSRIKEPIHINS